MKNKLLVATFFFTLLAFAGTAQIETDQNPAYLVSQARYIKMADSINSWHSTTPQETYKAIDYLEDKRELRANRKAWRQELRMERARNSGWYYNGYNNGYYSPYNSFYNGYGYYSRPWGFRNNWNNYLWGAAVPLGLGAAWWWSR